MEIYMFDYSVDLIIGLENGVWALDTYDVTAYDEWQAVEIARKRMFEKLVDKFGECDNYVFNTVYSIQKLLKKEENNNDTNEPDRDPLDTAYDYGYDGDGWE